MKHLIIAVLLGIAWASAFPFTQLALTGYSPLWIVALRLVLASIFLGAVMLVKVPATSVMPTDRIMCFKLIGLAVIGNVLPFFLITYGQQSVPSSIAALTIALVPFMAMVLAFVFLKQDTLSPRKIFAAYIGFFGVAIITVPSIQNGSIPQMLSFFAVLGAGVCYAITHIMAQILPQMPLIARAFWMNALAAVLGICLAFIIEGAPTVVMAGSVSVIWLGLVSTGLASLLMFTLLERGGTTITALAGNMVPVFGVGLSALLVGEVLVWQHGIALMFVLIALRIPR